MIEKNLAKLLDKINIIFKKQIKILENYTKKNKVISDM